MKVLLANSVFWPHMVGGAEAVVLLLSRELSARGVTVDVLASTGRTGGGELSTRRVDGVSGVVYEAPATGLYGLLDAVEDTKPPLPARAMHHLLGAHSDRWLRLARTVLRRTRPDILHTHTLAGLTPALWRAAHAEGIPVVHTAHDYHLLCARTTLLRTRGTICVRPPLPCRALLRAKLGPSRHVAVFTSPSRFTLERHLAEGAFPRARHLVVPNAPEPGPADRPVRDPATTGHGLFLGQLQVHKGVRELLAAVAALLDDAGRPDFRFTLAGDGPLRGEVERFCATRAPRCRYLGRVDGLEREAAFTDAGFLVLPSLWPEVSGLVLMEAAARGLPVIAPARGGCRELVADGETGQIIDPEPRALAAAMARYVDDPALARRHGEAGERRAAAWTRERQIETFQEIYRELAAMRPR